MQLQRKSIGLLVLASVLGFAAAAQAAPFGTNGSAVKVANATDPTKFDVYLADQGATEVTANLLGQTKSVIKVANLCGLAVFADSTSSPTSGVAGYSALPVQTTPTCSAAGVLSEPRTADFKTATNQIVKVGTASTAQSVIFPVVKTKKSTPRAGLLRLSGLTNAAGNDIAIGATNYDLTTIPTVTAKPITRQVSVGVYAVFIPAAWVTP